MKISTFNERVTFGLEGLVFGMRHRGMILHVTIPFISESGKEYTSFTVDGSKTGYDKALYDSSIDVLSYAIQGIGLEWQNNGFKVPKDHAAYAKFQAWADTLEDLHKVTVAYEELLSKTMGEFDKAYTKMEAE